MTSFYVAALLNCVFSSLACVPVYFAGKTDRRYTSGSPRRLDLGAISERDLFAIRMDLGHVAVGSARRDFALGNTSSSGNSSAPRRCRLRRALGVCSAHQPGTGLAVSVPSRVDRLPAIQSGEAGAPKPLLLTLALIISICLPWTIRNAVQFHRLIPLRSNFPFELWIGNNEIYDDHSREVNRITRYEQVHRYQELGETAYLAEKGQKAMSFIREHPSLTLRLAGRRVACDLAWHFLALERFCKSRFLSGAIPVLLECRDGDWRSCGDPPISGCSKPICVSAGELSGGVSDCLLLHADFTTIEASRATRSWLYCWRFRFSSSAE